MSLKSNESNRLPKDFRKSLLRYEERRSVYQVMRTGGLSTVCEEAKCPNIGECFANKQATFMIMGDRCTRRCHFCAVATKKPLPLDSDEPRKVAQAAKALGLDYVVVTSVDRDELADGGAQHFVNVAQAIKQEIPFAKIEVLVPDFRGKKDAIAMVLNSEIDVFAHNTESVARLYKLVRPQSNFEVTKRVLAQAAEESDLVVKSGMMVGLGENDQEVLETLTTLAELGVDIVTIGQYLRPSLSHWPVDRYVAQESYQAFIDFGTSVGIKHVFAGPYVRSSYNAKEVHSKV